MPWFVAAFSPACEVRNRETSGPSSSAEVSSPRWPSSKTWREELGSSACMIRAFTSGMMGSSFPARTKVGWRMSGRAGRLDQPTPARSWRK